MNSFAEENYLKVIYKVTESGGGFTSTNEVAKMNNTTPASVTDMLKRLAKKRFIRYKKYQGLSMTDSGRKVALAVIRKHRLWEMFLVKTLKFKWNEVHEVAEQLEHIRSEKLIQHIDKVLRFPRFDPHGDPIPDMNGNFLSPKEKPFLLSDAKEGLRCVVSGVVDHSNIFLKLLDKSSIKLGSKIIVEEIQTYDHSMLIMLQGKKRIYISNQISKNLLVNNAHNRDK